VAWVERSCAEQGPVKMTDPLALAEIADILLGPRASSDPRRHGSNSPGPCPTDET
jgi:hypothetical protein